jgi:hypothetical protein
LRCSEDTFDIEVRDTRVITAPLFGIAEMARIAGADDLRMQTQRRPAFRKVTLEWKDANRRRTDRGRHVHRSGGDADERAGTPSQCAECADPESARDIDDPRLILRLSQDGRVNCVVIFRAGEQYGRIESFRQQMG